MTRLPKHALRFAMTVALLIWIYYTATLSVAVSLTLIGIAIELQAWWTGLVQKKLTLLKKDVDDLK